MEENPAGKPVDEDRRDYFRIKDQVLLKFRQISAEDARSRQIPAAFSNDIGYGLIRELQLLDTEQSQLLRSIAEYNRDVELYLRHINRKLDLIATHLADSLQHQDESAYQPVTLSEGGIAFATHQAIPAGTFLVLQITLQPSHTALVLFSEVINSQATRDRFETAARFLPLSEPDRQLLARHIMQVQMAARRRSRGEPES